MVSNIECEDGNTVSGDGCSSDCKIEAGFSCRTMDDSNTPGKCVKSTETKFKKVLSKNNPLGFKINFSRAVKLTKESFDDKYSIKCTAKASNKIVSPRLDFKLTEDSPTDFTFNLESA